MVNKSHPPLWIRPAPSRRLLVYLLLIHALAACAIPLSGLNLLFKLAALGMLSLSLWNNGRRYVLMNSRTGLRQACWESDGRWLLQDGKGHWRHEDDYHAVWVNPKVILVRFGQAWRCPNSLLLVSDAVAAELHRQLRVRLTLQPRSRVSGEGM